jgi:DNA-binding IclR family transcriptional regulator
VLVCIARDPGSRLRDIAMAVGITERRAFAIVDDLTAAGYVLKERDGRRTRYQVQTHLLLPGADDTGPTIGMTLALLATPASDERRDDPRP